MKPTVSGRASASFEDRPGLHGKARSEWLKRTTQIFNGLEDQEDRLQMYEITPMEGFGEEFPRSAEAQRLAVAAREPLIDYAQRATYQNTTRQS